MKLILETNDYLNEYIEEDIKNITKLKLNKLSDVFYELDFKEDKELFNKFYELIYLSRTIIKIYLKDNKTYDKVLEKTNDYNLFETKITINKEKLKVFDLTLNLLEKRNYSLTKEFDEVNHNIVNYLLFSLGIQKLKDKYTILDPISRYSNVMIEASLFHPRKAMHIKERNLFPISKSFNFRTTIPKYDNDKNKYIAIVQENGEYKKSNENVSFSSQKIKLSKFELDMLDVKFKEDSIDFIISSLPVFNTKDENKEFLKEYFYRSEYVFKKKIGVISKEKINLSIPKKYKLKLDIFKEIKHKSFTYYIYIFK